MDYKPYKLKAKKSIYGDKLRKCSDNECNKEVPAYNSLCIQCLHKHKIQSYMHLQYLIAKDMNHKIFNKHLQHIYNRSFTS